MMRKRLIWLLCSTEFNFDAKETRKTLIIIGRNNSKRRDRVLLPVPRRARRFSLNELSDIDCVESISDHELMMAVDEMSCTGF